MNEAPQDENVHVCLYKQRETERNLIKASLVPFTQH